VIRRISTLLFVVAGLVAVACIDMSAPKGRPASISSLLLPSPSVVVGDTMRDSAGKAAPLRVIAYDANDVPTPGDAQFFVVDSAPVGHVANGIVVGDKQGSIHIIGQVAGVQTTPVTVPITVAPTAFALTGKIDTLRVPSAGINDTTSRSVGFATIAVTLRGVGDTASLGFVVKYELTKAPATIASSIPGIFFSDDGTKVSAVDTTDGGGASRKLYVRSWLLVDQALRAGSKVDSAVVIVSASYKGAPVFGSPIRVVIPIKGTIPQ
jgi:hypothetical protein